MDEVRELTQSFHIQHEPLVFDTSCSIVVLIDIHWAFSNLCGRDGSIDTILVGGTLASSSFQQRE
jgi:hypothetical protein